MKYHIYHVVGIKYGCTNNLERRFKQTRKRYGQDVVIEVVESFDDIDEASSKEVELNRIYKTKDRKPYSKMVEMQKNITYREGEQHHNFGQDISGSKNPNYGNAWTDEMKQRISEANSNPSQETRTKMRAAWTRKEKITCPYCGKQSISRSNMNRWHFDNCKNI